MDAGNSVFSSATRDLLKEEELLKGRGPYELKLSKRVSDLQDEISALQRRRNEISFANRLPDELLSKIFLLHAQNLKIVRKTIDESAETPNLRWIQISHVCKRWRMVAIGCTRLWSNLDFSRPRFAGIMLERSKNAPLHVQYDTSIHRKQSDSIVSDVLSHSDRLKSVELRNHSHNRLPYPPLLTAMGKTAPILEKLALSSSRARPSDLPEDFTIGGAPSLRHLELVNFEIRWDNIPLGRALTTLHLDTLSITHPKWDAFLSPLSEMRLLETLELHDVLPEEALARDELSALQLPIAFPSLKNMTLEDTTSRLCNFFDVVAIHQTTSISVLFDDDDRQRIAADIERCISQITTAWHLDGSPGNRKHVYSFAVDWPIVTKYAAGSHLLCALADLHDPSKIHPTSASLSLTFHEGFPEAMGFMDTVLASLTSHLTFTRINELKLGDDLVPCDAFKNRLAHLPMRHFILRNSMITDFLQIMNSDPSLTAPPSSTITESEPSTPASPHYFPALETITLEDEVEFDANSVELLITVLKRRPEGHRVEHLRIDDMCDFDRHDKRRIVDALPALELQWDGYDGDVVSPYHSNSQHLELTDSEEEELDLTPSYQVFFS